MKSSQVTSEVSHLLFHLVFCYRGSKCLIREQQRGSRLMVNHLRPTPFPPPRLPAAFLSHPAFDDSCTSHGASLPREELNVSSPDAPLRLTCEPHDGAVAACHSLVPVSVLSVTLKNLISDENKYHLYDSYAHLHFNVIAQHKTQKKVLCSRSNKYSNRHLVSYLCSLIVN